MINKTILSFSYLLTVVFVVFFAFEQSVEQSNYSLLLFVSAFVFIGICGKLCKCSTKNGLMQECNSAFSKSCLFAILILGCLLRLYFANKNVVEPISDFYVFYDEINVFSQKKVAFSKALGFVAPYGYLLQYIHTSVFSIQLITILVYLLSSLFVYILCSRLYGSNMSGLLAAFFVSTYPPFVLYSQIVASEHIWFMYLIIVFLLEFILLDVMNKDSNWHKLLTAFGVGFFIQLAALTRGNSTVLFPIVIFFTFLANQKSLKRYFFIVLVLCIGFLVPKGYIKYLEYSSGIKMTNDVSPAYVLVIGTNLETRGRFNAQSISQLNEMVAKKYGSGAKNASYLPVAFEFVYDKWKNNTAEEFQLAWNKIEWTLSERFHNWWFSWYTRNEDNITIGSASKQDMEYCMTVSPIYQIIFSLLSLFSLFVIPVLNKSRQLVLYSLIVFLFACLLLQGIHEYQPRYSLIYFLGIAVLGSSIGKTTVLDNDNIVLLKMAYNRYITLKNKVSAFVFRIRSFLPFSS